MKVKEAKKESRMTHAPTENKVHIVTWSEAMGGFWKKELPYNWTDDQIYKWISGNISDPQVKVFRGKEIIIRGRR